MSRSNTDHFFLDIYALLSCHAVSRRLRRLGCQDIFILHLCTRHVTLELSHMQE